VSELVIDGYCEVEFIQQVSNNPAVQARYEELRAAGQSHAMADMLAHRQFPGTRTEESFWRGRRVSDQFGETPAGKAMGEQYRAMAKAAGVNPHGKVYQAGLASYPGDPSAWVSDTSDVLRIAKEKNLNVSGAVTHKAADIEVPSHLDQPYEVAADVVDEAFEQKLATDPDLRFAPAEKQAEAKFKLKELHSGRK
jgi:hypothetical protein